MLKRNAEDNFQYMSLEDKNGRERLKINWEEKLETEIRNTISEYKFGREMLKTSSENKI